jgi:hypothetical protein
MSQTSLKLPRVASSPDENRALFDRLKAMEAASEALVLGARREAEDMKALRLRAEAALARDAAGLR